LPDVKTLIITSEAQMRIPLYLRAADVLVVPNTAKEDISRLYTSPMKLFEYMASGTPIVASDLPSIREIVDDSIVSFFAPDDPASLAETIGRVLYNYPEAEAKARLARERVKPYSWKRRAEAITHFIDG
jgi:glycosyltransferase involved in cell wall biosynthesis